ncbi:MAG: histidine phosphatase family protein [Clostridia bacterium]|nr:histidine phosphatase family protein [Clostridia bacterium]
MAKVYLVRHGETRWNTGFKVQGHTDVELTDRGRVQSMLLAERLLYEGIQHIYSSDLSRAYQTAEYVAEKLGKKTNKLKGLREVDFGIWEGLSLEHIKEKYPKEYNEWKEHPDKAVIPGERNLYNVQKRIMGCIVSLVERHEDENILIVSHGTVLKTAILGFMNIDMSLFNRMWLGNASISILDFKKDKVVLSLLNDGCHLRERKGYKI